jgi:prophage regulatory protein
MPERLLRFDAVSQMVGLKRTAIYAKIKLGEFPRPVPLGKRARAWKESEIQGVINGLEPVPPVALRVGRTA